jgi:hypothetical protein
LRLFGVGVGAHRTVDASHERRRKSRAGRKRVPSPSAQRAKYLPGPFLGKCLDQRTLDPAIESSSLGMRRKRRQVLERSGAVTHRR